tara:strand:+ start:433 stop:990 length:558 start_codon:yes stop_codon:yes gene_type:complete
MVQVVCISFVHTNIDAARISQIFKSIGWGTPKRIDIKARQPRLGQKPHNIVFIHFPVNILDARVNAQLEAGQDVKVVYDQPWFWKVRKYFDRSQQPAQCPAPYVDFGNNTSVPQQTFAKPQVATPCSWEQTPMGDPIWCQQPTEMTANMGWESFLLGLTQQGLGLSRPESAYNLATSLSTNQVNF